MTILDGPFLYHLFFVHSVHCPMSFYMILDKEAVIQVRRAPVIWVPVSLTPLTAEKGGKHILRQMMFIFPVRNMDANHIVFIAVYNFPNIRNTSVT